MTESPEAPAAEPADSDPPLPPDPWWKRVVFALAVVVLVIGLGLVITPQSPCTSREQAEGKRGCSIAAVRQQGGVLVAIGVVGVWVGRQSLLARRRSSAWDRSWR